MRLKTSNRWRRWLSDKIAKENAGFNDLLFRDLVEKSLVGIYVIQDGRFPYVNPRLAEIFGYSAEEVINGCTVNDLVWPEDREVVSENVRRRVAAEVKEIEYDFRGCRKDGSQIQVGVRGATTQWEGKSAVIGTLLDITTQKQHAQALQLTADALANTADAIIIMDDYHRVLLVNQAFADMTGYTEAESLHKTVEHLRPTRHTAQFYDQLWQTVNEKGWWRGELWFKRKDGSEFPTLLSASLVKHKAGSEKRFVVVFSDISQFKQYEARLEFLAGHDPLTGLPNRDLFLQRLGEAAQQLASRSGGMSVLLLDLDDFKQVNDSLGHGFGDEMLKATALRLREKLGQSNVIARLGGDEFAILCDETDTQVAAATAEYIFELLAEPFIVGDQELFATASIGISCYPQDGDEPSALLRAADAAMYKAKDEGRNTYQFYSTELNARALESLTIANQLRTAIERDEFFLAFQPIVELATQKFKGVEALLRWQHPELGLVPPMRCIPVAEKTGLILEIGDWVLETACRQAVSWQKDGVRPLVVSVNVSLRQLRQRDFARRVAKVLDKTGLSADCLKLEITETAVMDNPDRAIRLLSDIAKTGVKIAIDDFGVGYSSLSYLKRLPIDYLKIDRSFVKDLPNNTNDAAITRAIIAMARSLDLRLIAEGIEEDAQAEFLHQAGCEEGQGFLFSKPVRPDDLKEVLQKGKVA